MVILFPNFNDPRDELPLSSWRKPVLLIGRTMGQNGPGAQENNSALL